MSTGDRLSVQLTPRSRAALGACEQLTGNSTTDTVNRAIQVYAILVEQAGRAGVTTVTLPADSHDGPPLHLKVSRRPFGRWLPW